MRRMGIAGLFPVVSGCALACTQVLDLPSDVEVLCASGDECPGGFCGADHRCDERQWVVALQSDGRVSAAGARVTDGRVIVVGSFVGRLDVGEGLTRESAGEDVFVLALDDRGRPAWLRSFGGPGNERATVVSLDSDGSIILAGEYTEPFDMEGTPALPSVDPNHEGGFVAKLAPDGAPVWAQQVAASQDLSVDDATVFGGFVIVVGTYAGDDGVSGGEQLPAPPEGRVAGFILAVTPAGDAVRAFPVNGDHDVHPCCALVHPTVGSLVLGGHYDGTLLPPVCEPDVCVSEGGTSDIFFVSVPATALDPGSQITGGTAAMKTALADRLDALAVDASGLFLVAASVEDVVPGAAENVPGMGLIRGALQDIVAFDEPPPAVIRVPGGVAGETFAIVEVTAAVDGDLHALGYTEHPMEIVGPDVVVSSADRDAFLLTFDNNFTLAEPLLFGGPGAATPASIAIDSAGHVIVAGTFDGMLQLSAPFGRTTSTSRGQSAAFVCAITLE